VSKFNNPRAVQDAPPVSAGEASPQFLTPLDMASGEPDVAALPADVPEHTGSVQRLGFFVMCVYFLSGYANDFSMRLFHNKAYLSTVAELLLPFLLLICGAPFRALRLRPGKLWLFFFIWLAIDLPFSIWRTGTASLLLNYGPRSWIELFYIVSFAVTTVALRRLVRVQILGSVLLLLSCIAFGSAGSQRFDITGSLFYSNANELAMYLLFGMALLMFPIMRGSALTRVAAVAGLGVSMVYVLRTGSRGGLLGAIAMLVALLVLSRRRVLVFLLAAAGCICATLFVSTQSLHRLTLAFGGTSLADAVTGDDVSAIASRLQRRELLRRSIVLSFEHPVFGVGPGQFVVAVDAQAKEEGKRSSWLGTHNSYTQVSSECGFPALFCYCGVLWFCIRNNYKLFRATQDNEAASDINAISFCLLLSAVVYAVCTFFDHVAYSGVLPFIGGFSISLKLAADKSIAAWRRSQDAIAAY